MQVTLRLESSTVLPEGTDFVWNNKEKFTPKEIIKNTWHLSGEKLGGRGIVAPGHNKNGRLEKTTKSKLAVFRLAPRGPGDCGHAQSYNRVVGQTWKHSPSYTATSVKCRFLERFTGRHKKLKQNL